MSTVEGGTQPIDPRVEAAEAFSEALKLAMPSWKGAIPEDRILLALGFHSGWHKREEADREAGIVRVRVDDEAVERVVDALVMTRMGDYNIELWEFRNAARAVLAALAGEQP